MKFEVASVLTIFTIGLTILSSYITHIAYTIQHDQWWLLAIGAVAFPIAIIHGFMVWFGKGYGG